LLDNDQLLKKNTFTNFHTAHGNILQASKSKPTELVNEYTHTLFNNISAKSPTTGLSSLFFRNSLFIDAGSHTTQCTVLYR